MLREEKVLIVDDDISFARELRKLLTGYYAKNIEIMPVFNKALMMNKVFDIAFIDVDLGVNDGIDDVAKELLLINENILIVFMSNKLKYMKRSFQIRPIYFIDKSMIKEDLEIAFALLCETIQKRTLVLADISININTLIYIESHGEKVVLYFENDESLEIRERLKYVLEELSKYRLFIQIHKSYIVNKKYILSIKYSHVVLTNGNELPVGRKYYKLIRYEV